MFITRPYTCSDLPGCTACLLEGFFTAPITPSDLAFLADYTQVLIEKCHFTYVAESDGQVVGFISGSFQKSTLPQQARVHENRSHLHVWARLILKYLLQKHYLLKAFAKDFNLFFTKIGEVSKMKLGRCDCELTALCSRKAYRKGVGTALLDAFNKKCQDTGADTIRLFTNSSSNYLFYEKRGFHLVEERPYTIGQVKGKSMIYELQFSNC